MEKIKKSKQWRKGNQKRKRKKRQLIGIRRREMDEASRRDSSGTRDLVGHLLGPMGQPVFTPENCI